MAVSDLTNTTWIINAVPTIEGTPEYYDVTFNSNNAAFVAFLEGNNVGITYFDTNGDPLNVYVPYETPSGTTYIWSDENYRTIEITGGVDVTNASLISWLEANATQQGGGGQLTVTYNNTTIHTSSADDTFTLNCNGKVMATDVALDATNVDSLVVTYGGNTILSTSGTETRSLDCLGKYMSNNVGVDVVIGGTPPPSYPVKGDVISLDGVSGTFLVLNINGSVAEVLSRQSYSNNSFPSSSGQTYAGSNPDTRCNSNFYNAQSATFKAAIVDKTFRQDSWYRGTTGDPDYKGRYSTSTNYDISLGSATFGAEITRHCYSLSVQDVLDYLGVTTSMDYADSTLNRTNIRAMYNTTSASTWTRSANAANASQVMLVNGSTGAIIGGANSSSYNIRPAFQIDLSKIDFAIQ